MSISKKTVKISKKQNVEQRNLNPKTPRKKAVPFTQSKRMKSGGSYTSGKKRLSRKTRTRKGSTLKSRITGVQIRGKQLGRRGSKRP